MWNRVDFPSGNFDARWTVWCETKNHFLKYQNSATDSTPSETIRHFEGMITVGCCMSQPYVIPHIVEESRCPTLSIDSQTFACGLTSLFCFFDSHILDELAVL
jgi:hypothetical protein